MAINISFHQITLKFLFHFWFPSCSCFAINANSLRIPSGIGGGVGKCAPCRINNFWFLKFLYQYYFLKYSYHRLISIFISCVWYTVCFTIWCFEWIFSNCFSTPFFSNLFLFTLFTGFDAIVSFIAEWVCSITRNRLF